MFSKGASDIDFVLEGQGHVVATWVSQAEGKAKRNACGARGGVPSETAYPEMCVVAQTISRACALFKRCFSPGALALAGLDVDIASREIIGHAMQFAACERGPNAPSGMLLRRRRLIREHRVVKVALGDWQLYQGRAASSQHTRKGTLSRQDHIAHIGHGVGEGGMSSGIVGWKREKKERAVLTLVFPLHGEILQRRCCKRRWRSTESLVDDARYNGSPWLRVSPPTIVAVGAGRRTTRFPRAQQGLCVAFNQEEHGGTTFVTE